MRAIELSDDACKVIDELRMLLKHAEAERDEARRLAESYRDRCADNCAHNDFIEENRLPWEVEK